jgi:hypothetical protein
MRNTMWTPTCLFALIASASTAFAEPPQNRSERLRNGDNRNEFQAPMPPSPVLRVLAVDQDGSNLTSWHVAGDLEGITVADPNSLFPVWVSKTRTASLN